MAQLTATPVGDRIHEGRYVIQEFRTNATGAGAADEWIRTGFRTVVSAQVTPTGTAAPGHAVVLNAQGTGQAENSSQGDLGIETSAAATGGCLVRVRGLL